MKKKILSLCLSVALLVAACSVMAACGDEAQTTGSSVTTTPTTQTSETTQATTTTQTTTTTKETTQATTKETTQATTTTQTTITTTTGDTTTLKLNSVLDFAESNTAIVEQLKNAAHDSSAITIESGKDSIVIYATKNYDKDVDTADTYSVTFSLEGLDTLKSGYGTYEGRPWYVSSAAAWHGNHQYMAISFEAPKDAKYKYIGIKFTFTDGTTVTLDPISNFTTDNNGVKSAVIDLVKFTAEGEVTSDKLPNSAWGTSKEVKSVTFNFFGCGLTTQTNEKAFAPEAGDYITINYVIFASDYEAATNYGTETAE